MNHAHFCKHCKLVVAVNFSWPKMSCSSMLLLFGVKKVCVTPHAIILDITNIITTGNKNIEDEFQTLLWLVLIEGGRCTNFAIIILRCMSCYNDNYRDFRPCAILPSANFG